MVSDPNSPKAANQSRWTAAQCFLEPFEAARIASARSWISAAPTSSAPAIVTMLVRLGLRSPRSMRTHRHGPDRRDRQPCPATREGGDPPPQRVRLHDASRPRVLQAHRLRLTDARRGRSRQSDRSRSRAIPSRTHRHGSPTRGQDASRVASLQQPVQTTGMKYGVGCCPVVFVGSFDQDRGSCGKTQWWGRPSCIWAASPSMTIWPPLRLTWLG